jgi:hypothetical protein
MQKPTGQDYNHAPGAQATRAPQIILKTINIKELGVTNTHLEHVVDIFLRYFEDARIRLFSSVFAYCKNSYYCIDTSGHYTHFAVVRSYCGRCCDYDDFQQYFLLGLYNELLGSNKVPAESEIESKIIEYYRTHIRINTRDPIIIYKILEAARTIWIVKLPGDC